jgi:AbrB family looped-hinge helix DNA binding protein
MTATITSKGQVCVPIKLRRKLGLESGGPVSFTYRNGEIIIRPMVDKIPVLSDTELSEALDPNHQAEAEAMQKACSASLPDHYTE